MLPTEREVSVALELLERFITTALSLETQQIPEVDDVKFAVATVILYFGFNEEDYEIRNLIKTLESRKGVSYSELRSHLPNFVSHARELLYTRSSSAFYGETSGDDLF
ncbi:hypothetical protein [Halopseudomonas bauzanensis]|uniref:Uncharacterized protein n=1 Tax=Halopseudomonas bauzanensis TaxID=653930 RepID=A0A4U0YJS4_9GAMM|nr:hypothetical protein [Halopseudomonas bauzanensis]TKA90366.1 hypothetical protein FA869_14710 [Halopseudomonas bauzanensis]